MKLSIFLKKRIKRNRTVLLSKAVFMLVKPKKGRVMMKRLTTSMLTVFALTILFSNITFAINIPLRVLVNGEELYFPDEKPFIDANGRRRHRQGLLEKLWSYSNLGCKC